MTSKTQITLGNPYTFQDKKGFLPWVVRAVSFAEGSHTIVNVMPVFCEDLPDGEYPEQPVHIKYLTAQPLEEVKTNFIPNSKDEVTFTR